MKKIIFLSFLILVLQGCSTAPKGAFKLDTSTVLSDKDTLIVICRPSAVLASGVAPDVWINNEIAAELGSGSILEIVSQQGKKRIDFKSTTFRNAEGFGVDTTTENGKVKYFLMAPNLENFFALPIAGVFYSSISVKWQVAEANKSIVDKSCSGLNKTRIRSLNYFK
jgi:hypothetical protein